MAYYDFDRAFYKALSDLKNSIVTKPLVLGGIATVSGGGGGPPGGFIGYLPQNRVAYDTLETASNLTPASGVSLYDNLNHIRYRLQRLEASGVGGAGGGVSGPVSSTDNALVRWDGAGGNTVQNSLILVTDVGGINIPTGQTYNINGSPHTHTVPKLDDLSSPDNNTDLNVSTTAHGLMPILPNDSTKFINGIGNWVTISGGGGTTVVFSGASNVGWFNVKDYGATGNGSTDETSAISSANAAKELAGGGVLYFPPGIYKTSGNFTLATPTIVLGMGMAGFDGYTGAISLINCTSQTNSLFIVSCYKAYFKDIALQNTYGGTPSAGAAITVAGSTLVQRVDYDSVSVRGFYNNIDVQVGCGWSLVKSWLTAPVKYALKVRNTQNEDAGDWSISDTGFFAAVYDSDAAIRIESSGGGKISHIKINKALDGKEFNHGIDVAMAGGDPTSILLVSTNSIENIRGDAIHVTTSGVAFNYLDISNNQFALYSNNSGRAINIIANTINEINAVTIGNNIYVTDGTARAAVSLTRVNNVRIDPGTLTGFSDLLTQTSCTNVSQGSTTTSSGGGYSQHARVYNTGTYTLVNGEGHAIPFNAESYDTDNIHDNSTNNTRLTCQTAGKYILTGNVSFQSSASGFRNCYIQVTVGATPHYIGANSTNAVNGDRTYLCVTDTWDMQVGDYAEFFVFQNTGNDLGIDGGGFITNFTMTRVG